MTSNVFKMNFKIFLILQLTAVYMSGERRGEWRFKCQVCRYELSAVNLSGERQIQRHFSSGVYEYL